MSTETPNENQCQFVQNSNDSQNDQKPISSHEYSAILELQQSVLEMVALGQEDDAILAELCRLEEHLVPNAVASIMLLDKAHQHLNVLSAPSIPETGIVQLNGLKPGPGAGSCGNAVYRGEPVFVSNTLTDPRWHDIRHLAQNFGLCACWSMPVKSTDKSVIGTFALSSFEHRMPNSFHRRLLEIGAFIVSIVLKRREQERLLAQHARRLQLASTAFENAADGIIITDRDVHIIEVNRAFETIFGYTQAEVQGTNPSMLSSGRHDAHFYRNFWNTLQSTGQWSGEIWNKRRSGEVVPLWVSITQIPHAEDPGNCNYLAVYTDLSELRESQEKLRFMAYHDPLTGLSNRVHLFECLEQGIHNAMRNNNKLALLFLDLDRFKNLNDTFGHLIGDKVLIQVANRLKSNVRQPDTVVRLGGDEFVIMLDEIQDPDLVYQIANKLLAHLQEPFHYEQHEFLLRGSIGIVMYPRDGESAETLLKHADAAMYKAKAEGGDNISFYSPDLSVKAQEVFTIESDLHQALKNKEFTLYFQPKVDAQSGEIVGAEGLIRWQHKQRGMLSPGVFIPIAEQSNLVLAISEWVFREGCRHIRHWLAQGIQPVPVSLNLSGRQFTQEGIANVLAIIAEANIPPGSVEIELTETFLMQNVESSSDLLGRLRRAQIKLAIDDFGSGYSSLGYLKRFKVDALKIDQSLVRDIVVDPNDLAIARAIVALAHTLELEVVAEGVETEQQKVLLQQSGCDLFQGFLSGKPMPADEFAQLLQHRVLPPKG